MLRIAVRKALTSDDVWTVVERQTSMSRRKDISLERTVVEMCAAATQGAGLHGKRAGRSRGGADGDDTVVEL